jgi:hypothetical protein
MIGMIELYLGENQFRNQINSLFWIWKSSKKLKFKLIYNIIKWFCNMGLRKRKIM